MASAGPFAGAGEDAAPTAGAGAGAIAGAALPATVASPEAVPGGTASAASATPGACPSCGADNIFDALFCEACGHDLTTGSMPRPLEPPAGVPGPDAATAPVHPAPSSDPDAPFAPTVPGPDPLDANPSPAPAQPWVAEVWVDPKWYSDQESTDPLPSPGLAEVVALRHSSILIGRASRSRGVAPDVDLSSDTGISRRHAQLTTDGTRWWVEDLGSANGTFVGSALDNLPELVVPPGQKKEVGPDDRVHLGACTRLVVRRAAPGEV